jgi:predicted pyridoxine 5'-phosphate oxidase superfamily flavin-nucleotide-binding protein
MNPFHQGEVEVQRRAGVAATAEKVGRIIRREIPEVARAFAAERRFVILGAADVEERVWATVLRGEPGFLSAPSDDRLVVNARPAAGDPLGPTLAGEADVGLLLIDPPTRRRMRVNGRTLPTEDGSLVVTTREVYSNCPKYITPRRVTLGPDTKDARVIADRGPTLTPAQARRLATTDTLFIATRHPVAGADVSHRGGALGFVRVTAVGSLLMPDYRGNMMFNTLGNLAVDPRAGLLVVDFDRGDTLQLTGRAVVLWGAEELASFPGAERLVEFRVDEVVETCRS